MPLARYQVADAHYQRNVRFHAERAARTGAIGKVKDGRVDGVLHYAHTLFRNATLHGERFQGMTDCHAPGGATHGIDELRTDTRPQHEFRLEATQGNEHRQLQRCPDPGAAGAVRISEVGIDQVDALLTVQALHHWADSESQPSGIP